MIEWLEAIVDEFNYPDLRLKALNENENRHQNAGVSLFHVVTGWLHDGGEEKNRQNTSC